MTANKLEGKARELLAAEVAAMPRTHEACDYQAEYEAAALRAIVRALDTARPNDLDATVAQRDALAGKVVAYRMFDREAVEAFRKWCPWIDGAPSQASLDALKDRCEFEFAYSGTARQSEGMVLVPREALIALQADVSDHSSLAYERIRAWLAAAAPQAGKECDCRACRPLTVSDLRMIVCAICGNKRCPHANDHRHECTNSNESGQPGSAYPATQPERDGRGNG